jgi:hypothetical protein
MNSQTRIAPADMLQVLGHIAALDWRPLTETDFFAFADAGEGARIAEVPAHRQGAICETLDLRACIEHGMMAIIGGDGLQIELHGSTQDGEPIAWTLPLEPFEQ